MSVSRFAQLNLSRLHPASLYVRSAALLLLTVLALLSVVSFARVTGRVETQQRDAQLINVAGQQRMLSQRIALLGQQLVLSQTSQRQSLREDLSKALNQMAEAHKKLIDVDSSLYPPQTPAQDVRDLYFGASALDGQVRAFLLAGWRLQQAPNRQLTQLNADLVTLQIAAQGSLLPALDVVVTIDGIHVRERLFQLDSVALGSLLLTLVTLGVVGLGLLFPMIRRQEQAVADLEREHNFVQQVMNNMGQGLGITGPDHLYRYVNPAYARMVGRTPESMIGMSSFELIEPAEHNGLMAARAERLAGRASRQNITFRRPDGQSVPTLTVVVPYETGEGVGGIAVITDLSERIRVEQQLRQRDRLYHTVAANFPDGTLMLFDSSLRYTLVDGTGLKSVGLSAELLEGKTPSEVYSPEVAALIEADYRAALLGQVTEREMVREGGIDLIRTLPLRTEPDPASPQSEAASGEVFGGMSITQDITLRRQAEIDLSRAATYTAALLEVSKLAQSEMSLEKVAIDAARVVGKAGDVDWGSLVVKEGDQLRIVAAWDKTEKTQEIDHFAVIMEEGLTRGQGLIWKVMQGQEGLFIDDYCSQSGAHEPFVQFGVRSVAFVPLTTLGEQQFLYVAVRRGERRPWTTEDQALFQAAASSVRINLERQHYLLELEHAALIDSLTGLGNRRAFEQDLARELERRRRSKDPVGVLMVDVDGLKQLNDCEGHERGDALLVTFAGTLSSSLRAEDRVYRLGGDEYAAILVRASSSGCETLMQRVRNAVAKTRVAGFPEVDASAGLAFAEGDDDQGSDLLNLADERMYLEKQEHRRLRTAAAIR
ncbi:diguanylate cyclase [Deinococcus psychrotolerans]|uniref:Diguanylate cyclase n=1 Tax=Deinococcus psychrotolerans TaxID=2489213 RepID=A0A3G8YR13_9DEIO|nr:diguanylate cyclase [Deinococcus psychrotolerans]AZI44151.1 diguanylate cyclase [Deinococcus psychrotolerans]